MKKEKKITIQYTRNIQGIYIFMYIPALGNIHGIFMVYTMDIRCKIFIGVPDDVCRKACNALLGAFWDVFFSTFSL